MSAINLSNLPAPAVVEEIDYENILADMVTDLQSRDPEFQELLDSDPAMKILQVAAYRESLVRQRVNEAARSVMLAYAKGSDLDNLAAFFKVERLVLNEGDPDADPPVPPSYESDEDFLKRIQLALDSYSIAGPEGAYVYHALSASADVKDAAAAAPKFSMASIDQGIMDQLPPNSIVLQVDDDAGLTDPKPGDVAITVLSRTGDGTADQALIDEVAAVYSEDVRPLTDNPRVRGANILTYNVDATLYFYSGPGSEEVMAEAQAAIEAYTKEQHNIGRDITLSGIYAALHQPGVQRVDLHSPTSNLVVDTRSAAFCTAINLTHGGLDE